MRSRPVHLKWAHTVISVVLHAIMIAGCLVMTACANKKHVAPRLTHTATPIPQMSTTGQPTGTFIDNIPYAGVADSYRLLSVRLPENAFPPFPTIVMFHSGVFVQGDKADMDDVALALSERGIAVVNVNYRCDRYPAPVEDAFCALAWVHHEFQNYGFDTDRIIVLGADVGGSLAALLGLVTDPSPFLQKCPQSTLPLSPVAGVVSYGATYHFGAMEDFMVSRRIDKYNAYLDRMQEGYEQRVWQASPASYIHADAPPFLLFHGLNDRVVIPEHTRKFASALEAEGVPVEFVELLGVDQYLFELNLVELEDMQLDKVEAFIHQL